MKRIRMNKKEVISEIKWQIENSDFVKLSNVRGLSLKRELKGVEGDIQGYRGVYMGMLCGKYLQEITKIFDNKMWLEAYEKVLTSQGNDKKTRLTKLMKKKILKRDKNKCRICKSNRGIEAHHIILYSDGGKSIDKNLISLCWRCHKELTLFFDPLIHIIKIVRDYFKLSH